MSFWGKKFLILGLVMALCTFFAFPLSAATVEVSELLSDDLDNWVISFGNGGDAVVQDNASLIQDGKLVIDTAANLHMFYKGSKGPKDGDTLQFTIKIDTQPHGWFAVFFRSSPITSYVAQNAPAVWDAGTAKYYLQFWGDYPGATSLVKACGWDDNHQNQNLTDNAVNPLYDGEEHLVQITATNVENGNVKLRFAVDGEELFGLDAGYFIEQNLKYTNETGFFGFQSYSENQRIKLEIYDVTLTNPTPTEAKSSTSNTVSTAPETNDDGVLFFLIVATILAGFMLIFIRIIYRSRIRG